MARALQVARGGFAIVDALNAEWQRLSDTHEPAVRAWVERHDVLARCYSLGDVLRAISDDADAVLYALLAETRAGDELAGRVVLQAMLGKVVRLSNRDSRAGADEYVAAMWCRLRTYPLLDRPERIAANLALDVLKAVQQEHRWGARALRVELLPADESLDVVQSHATNLIELDHGHDVAQLSAADVISLADDLGLIDVPTRDVLLSVYADGLSGRAAARLHRTSAEMIRYRCSRGVRRMAQHSSSLAAAA